MDQRTTPVRCYGLEHLGCCPVCGCADRSVLHDELVDNVFFCAPGKWTQWKCAKCNSAYLDPRPTQATIHLAYANYYTHQDAVGKDDYTTLSLLRKLRRQLVNGYTNWRYSTRNVPASAFGILAAFLMPNLKKVLDRQYRHLPRFSGIGSSRGGSAAVCQLRRYTVRCRPRTARLCHCQAAR